jgi:GT2 family glycosyltransferase
MRSIAQHTSGIAYEIIVVDNASPDRSIEDLPSLFPEQLIQMVLLNSNKGFGAGNNAGLAVAKGKYIFLLNPDTLLCSNAAKYFYEYMEQQAQQSASANFLGSSLTVAACGADIIDEKGNSIQAYGNFPTLFSAFAECGPKFFFLRYFKKHMAIGGPNYDQKNKKVDYLTGSAMFIRISIIDKTGFFDEDFFLYFEETELAYRFNKMGYAMMLLPEVKIIHLEGVVVSNNFQGLQKFTWYEQSRQLFYKKTKGTLFAATMKFFDLTQLILRTLAGKEKGPLISKLAIIWKA